MEILPCDISSSKLSYFAICCSSCGSSAGMSLWSFPLYLFDVYVSRQYLGFVLHGKWNEISNMLERTMVIVSFISISRQTLILSWSAKNNCYQFFFTFSIEKVMFLRDISVTWAMVLTSYIPYIVELCAYEAKRSWRSCTSGWMTGRGGTTMVKVVYTQPGRTTPYNGHGKMLQ